MSNREYAVSRKTPLVTLDQAGWNRAALVTRSPPPTLSGIVELLSIDERPRNSPRGHQWRVVADDAPHIIYCRFDDDAGERHRLRVVGARTRYIDLDCSRRTLTVGARLRPGAIPALFGVDASELTNRSIPAELLVRDAARETLARLELESAEHTLIHIVSFLKALVRHGREVDRRARRLDTITSTRPGTVRGVADALGIGDRALRSWSSAHLGLGLRRFLRIRRLHDALETRLTNPGTTWSRIAAATGFADQPHLVRDCRALLGESPTEFFARAS